MVQFTHRMWNASTRQHLRLLFSWQLLPVYLFAISRAPQNIPSSVWWLGLILHFLVYPASNAFNSFYDRDEKSIGEVERPLPVTPQLLQVANSMEAMAGFLAASMGWRAGVCVLLYMLVSRAYSHPAVRLKAQPFTGWLTIAVMQGTFIFYTVRLLADGGEWHPDYFCYFVAALLVGAGYPISQIYQHEEDKRRGDRTLSRLLGVRGTLVFCGVCLLILQGALFYLYRSDHTALYWVELSILPTAAYFIWWAFKVWGDERYADFRHVRTLTRLGATSFNIAFTALILLGRN